MHEASIAQNVIDSVQTLIEEGKVSGTVRTVALRVGKLTAVVPENLTFMFSVLTEGGPLQGVRLEIEQVSVRSACVACGFEEELQEPRFLCGACGSAEVKLLSGRELLIQFVEVE